MLATLLVPFLLSNVADDFHFILPPRIEWFFDCFKDFKKTDRVVPSWQTNWDTMLYEKRCRTPEEAMLIALEDSDVDYFFFTNSMILFLRDSDGDEHVYSYGDCLFFTGQPIWDEDRKGVGYQKKSSE